MEESPAKVPGHMETTLGLYCGGVAEIRLQNAICKAQSLQNKRMSMTSSTHMSRSGGKSWRMTTGTSLSKALPGRLGVGFL